MFKVCKTKWCYDHKSEAVYDIGFDNCDTCHNPLVEETQKSLFEQKKKTQTKALDSEQLAYWESVGAFNKY